MGILSLPNAGHPQNGEDLNADVVRQQIQTLLGYLQAFDGSNVNNGSILAAALDQSINANTWRAESFPSYITAGGLPSGYTLLQLTVPSINSAYFKSTGARLVGIAGATYTVAINNDTYFSLGPNGVIDTPQGVSNGAAAPSLPSGSQWLFRAISNGTTITSIVDMRVLSPITAENTYTSYKFKVKPTADYVHTTGAKVQFGTKVFDTGSNFDAVTNYRYTIPANGFYQFNASVVGNSNAGGGTVYTCSINKNGAAVAYSGEVDTYATTFDHAYSASAFEQCVVGDYFEVIHQGGGAGDTIRANTTFFSGFMVSKY